jgi:2-desacetyl-2-hydroxyethyl bacteriochlorophyllide A dehydrogenase
MMMKTFLLFGPQDIRLSEKSIPNHGADEVLVKPKFMGICGSDVHYYRHGFCGNYVPKKPFALGHEFSGIIHSIGENVQGLKVGDEVAVDPSMPCRICKHCCSGHYNLCLSMKYFGSASCDPHIDGSMAQFVVVPAANCYVLPSGITMAQASLLEPLCVAMHAVRQAGRIAGSSILITGGGPIGQLILRVVKAFGSFDITVSDVDEFSREFALKSGASHVVNPLDENAWKSSAGFDIVFEASGVPSALANGIQVVRRGGTVVLVGTLPEQFSIPGNLIMNRELKLHGSFRFANVFEDSMKLVSAGIINLEGIVTDVFRFEDIPMAMEKALEKNGVMKIQIAL